MGFQPLPAGFAPIAGIPLPKVPSLTLKMASASAWRPSSAYICQASWLAPALQ